VRHPGALGAASLRAISHISPHFASSCFGRCIFDPFSGPGVGKLAPLPSQKTSTVLLEALVVEALLASR
jgi:hypothetical protein